MTTRWTLADSTTPSGKAKFVCDSCRRESVTPDKDCPAGCGKPEREPRPAGCACHWEAGDSPCPVHPSADDEVTR